MPRKVGKVGKFAKVGKVANFPNFATLATLALGTYFSYVSGGYPPLRCYGHVWDSGIGSKHDFTHSLGLELVDIVALQHFGYVGT